MVSCDAAMTWREALTATGCTCDPTFEVELGELVIVHDDTCFRAVVLELDDLRSLTR
jgi:hypothetical protein